MKNKDIKIYYEEFLQEYQQYFLTLEEQWNDNLQQVKIYINKNKKRPTDHSKDQDIKKLGTWLSTQQQNYKKNINCMINPEIKLEYETFIQEYQQYFT